MKEGKKGNVNDEGRGERKREKKMITRVKTNGIAAIFGAGKSESD